MYEFNFKYLKPKIPMDKNVIDHIAEAKTTCDPTDDRHHDFVDQAFYHGSEKSFDSNPHHRIDEVPFECESLKFF